MADSEASPSIVLGMIAALAGVAVFLSVLAMMYGLGCVASGLWGLIRHGHFAGEPMWQFLGLRQSANKALSWDRSIWLIVGGLAVFGVTSEAADELANLRSKTPAQRAAARAQARERAEAAAEREMRRKEAEMLERTQLRARQRPMSGWRRLWIVLSILLGIPAFAAAYDGSSESLFFVRMSNTELALPNDQRDRVFWQRASEQPESWKCVQGTMKARDYAFSGGWYVQCTNELWSWIFQALFWAFMPGVIMWVVGKTVRWVYRGFRPIPNRSGTEATGAGS